MFKIQKYVPYEINQRNFLFINILSRILYGACIISDFLGTLFFQSLRKKVLRKIEKVSQEITKVNKNDNYIKENR